jgi:hypothetical protein
MLALAIAMQLVPAASHPPDPFAEEYVVPKQEDVGTTAGQFRAMGSGTIGLGPSGPAVGAQGTLELMTFAYLGVRGTLAGDAFHREGDPGVWLAKTGPSLHLLPYRRFDIGAFFEAGIGVLDPVDDHRTAMPVLSPGGTIDLWIASSWFLHTEGHIDWGIYELGQGPRAHLRFVGCAGLGFAL